MSVGMSKEQQTPELQDPCEGDAARFPGLITLVGVSAGPGCSRRWKGSEEPLTPQ